MKYSISLASRYVAAFYEYLSESNKLDKLESYVEAIKRVVDKIESDEMFYNLIGNPLLPKDYIVMQIVKVSEIDDADFNKFIEVLIYKKRQLMLPIIYMLLEKKNEELKKIVNVKMITPYKLQEKTIEELKEIVLKKTGRKAILDSEIDEELIGGLQLQLEDKIFDYSIKAILEKIGRDYASKRG
ncbi:F-type H+-transporting ATPase subunit delta [Marinitoga hydrogenitolerans DSM 16785]|uniref:ATP synthase subunit delta n=1 Tax=Marinitoga hydrogenitolerans (strain DSM 16785 / JCM 12826 / AT1271) TaxID=1122195 RepID=A0A1M4S7S0_MARH1|nr:ATP synthase F1 subunit delta [Marinitoga hydrogenitolerans]SHE28215.1 F-type H+-transporting ATPase subunit delta [Marinitoga hydrogenitolerans DSM 16785]